MTINQRPTPATADILAAAESVKPHVRRTPVLRADALDQMAGANLFCKAECLQITGSFKIRGATNSLLQIQHKYGNRDVVAFSSGNHAQGVARAARWFGINATIVMPETAPDVKIEGVRADGAAIRLYDPGQENREEIAQAIADDTDAVVVPSFDDPDIVSGQGSCGVEFLEQMTAQGHALDGLICCTGGGGLVSGISLAFDGEPTRIWTAEPQAHDDWARSLKAGQQVANAPGIRSICDAILTPRPGDIPWQIGQTRLSGGIAVSDEHVLIAMKRAFQYLKVVLEPGGAVALAAALYALPDGLRGKNVGVILSGGNVDPDMFGRALTVNYP